MTKRPKKWCMRCRTRHLLTTPHDNELDKAKLQRRGTGAAAPIIIECEECDGSGKVQAACVNCNVDLTTSNQADAGTEGLLIDCCAKCWREDLP